MKFLFSISFFLLLILGGVQAQTAVHMEQLDQFNIKVGQVQDGMDYIVLNGGQSFESQISKTNTIYEIRHSFDLRISHDDFVLSQKVTVGGVIYYTHKIPLTLIANQTLWLPSNCVVLNANKNKCLGENETYRPLESVKVYIASTTSQRITYKVDGVVTIPDGCILKFKGGKLKNGIVVNCGKIENGGNAKIFSDILFVTPEKQFVKLAWFEYASDADALENAAKFGHIDGTGTWIIDKTVNINEDLQLENGDFSCLFGIHNIRIGSLKQETISFERIIEAGSKEIKVSTKVQDAGAVSISSSDTFFKTERNTHRYGTCGELMIIDSIFKNRVVFNTKSGTLCSYTKNTKLTFFRPINVSLTACRFYSKFETTTERGGVLVSIGYAKANVSNCIFSGCSVGLNLGACINSVVSSCTFENIYPWAIAFSDGTCNSNVIGCTFEANRHAWTTLGEASVVKFCQITSNVCRNSKLAICPHANAFGITISNNMVKDSEGGLGSYAPNSIIKDNTITNTNGLPSIYLTEAGGINPVVQGNVIENCHGTGCAIRNNSLDLTTDQCCIQLKYCEIKDNIIRDCPDFSGINCDYSKVSQVVPVTITNNTIRDIGYTGIAVKGALATVSNNQVHHVSRSRYIPITISCPDKTKANKFAYIVGNIISFCNNIYYASVEGFESVVFYLNENYPDDKMVKFDKCKQIKSNPTYLQTGNN